MVITLQLLVKAILKPQASSYGEKRLPFVTLTLLTMKTHILALLISLVLFHSFGVCQNQIDDCNEKEGSPQKLFVFIGELLHAKDVSGEKRVNEVRFSATYRIVDRICGSYKGDTISFDVIQFRYDSSFMKNKYQLLMLTKDTGQNEDFKLWGYLRFDVFKTAKNQWAVPYMLKNDRDYAGLKPLKPKKTSFFEDAFYDIRGMTREEIDVTYPEEFYKIKKDKAIPLLGSSIDEIFQHEKEGTLANANMYDHLPMDDPDRNIVVKEVEMAAFKEPDPDSLKQANEKAYLAIKDSLLINPFDERKIRELIENCRSREDYSLCTQYLDNLLHDYPDSVNVYLLDAKLRRPRGSLKDSSRILVLQQAIKVDSSNYDANYELALSYYRLFKLQQNNHYAYAARKSFIRCTAIDTTELAFLKFPIIQLSNYLNDSNTVNTYKKFSYEVRTNAQGIPVANKHNWYFPIEPFMRDSTKWMTDYTIDMIIELPSANSTLDMFSKDLAWFKEPMLSAGYKGKVYRFLWIRSFDYPIVIRMQKIKRSVTIYWKLPQFDDSLHTSQSPVEFKKKLAIRQWKKFEKMLTAIDYWSMIPREYLRSAGAATDGDILLLEAAINGKYKVTERFDEIYPKYTKCLMYLIKLTDLNLPEDKIY